MTKQLPISAVIFDMDGLMFDTERIALMADIQAGKVMGYDLAEDLVVGTVGLNLDDTRRYYLNHFGPDYPFDAIRSLRYEIAGAFIQDHGLPVKDGLLDLLDFLKRHSIPRALATSSDRDKTQGYLDMAGIGHYFGAIVCGGEVARGKPEPDIFLKAAEQIGVDPASCLVLEDSEHGILAASRAGMLPVAVPDLKQPAAQILKLATRTCSTLLEVRDYLETLLT